MIAYISPLVPKHTGIALYSHHLIKALNQALGKKNRDLTVFDDDVTETNCYQSDYEAKELLPLIFDAKQREKYSHFIYHFGNNPSFHLAILHLLQKQKGIVVLHDTVLFFLVAGQGTGALWQALNKQGEEDCLETITQIMSNSLDGNPLNYSSPEKYPLLHEVLTHATAVVVHSQLATSYVKTAGFKGPIYQVPLIDYQQLTTVNSSSIESNVLLDLFDQKSSNGTFIIGLFGFSGATKRSDSIFQALSELNDTLKSKIKLLIVGSNQYNEKIKAIGLSTMVVNCGRISDNDYDQSLALCDLIINLRYPSMGETSAVQIQAMSAECPTIVSNHGWFKELPDDSVVKISIDNNEVEELKQALLKMIEDDAYRLSIAAQAKKYINDYHAPEIVSKQWLEILSL